MMSLFNIILFGCLSAMVSSGFFSWYYPYGLFQIRVPFCLAEVCS